MRMMIVLSLVLPLAALAEPEGNTERAREAFAAAQKLYQASRFTEALKKFEEAQVLKPHPVIIFNIARCHEQLGAVPQALKAYREYLRLSPEAADREAVVASIAALEKRLPRTATQQQLVVNAEPAGATVMLDGKRAGSAPITLELSAGEHALEVSADGFETLKRKVSVAPQRTVEVNVALKAVAPVAVVADAPHKEPELTPVESPPPSPPLVVTAPLEKPRQRTVTWIVGGLAIAAAGTAVGLGVGANGTVAQLRSGDGTRTQQQSGELATSAQGLSTGANVAWGLAGAAAITAVILFFVEGK